MLTQERLIEILNYDPESGKFSWKVSNNGRIIVGSIAGSTRKDGYLHIKIDGKKYLNHRLAWLYIYGDFPSKFIDHINTSKNDNRISNLREATRSENGMNRLKYSSNKSGYKGVSLDNEKQKWKAQLRFKGKNISGGYFDNPYEAHLAYQKLSTEYFGEFVNFG